MKNFWGFAEIVVICITILLVVFVVLISIPNSPFKKIGAKIFGYILYAITGTSLLYILSPLDIIPDIIPVAGQADDVGAGIFGGISALMGWLLLRMAKKYKLNKE